MGHKLVLYKGLLCNFKEGSYKRGFTLIEVMLATVLIVIGVAAVVGTMSSGVSSDRSVEAEVIALNLAQQKMEAIKNTSYASLASLTRTSVGGDFSNFDWEVVLDQTNFTGNTTFDATKPAVQVTVNVYGTYGWIQDTVSLTTLIAKS